MCVSVCVWVRVWVCLGVSGCVSVSGCGLSECVCARMLACARVMHVWQGVGRNTHESVSPRPSLTCCASSAEASRASQASPPSAPSPVSPLPAVCRHPPPRPAHGATAREDRAEGESPGALVAWHAMSTRPTHPDPHGIPCKVVGASSTLPVRACSNADRQQRFAARALAKEARPVGEQRTVLCSLSARERRELRHAPPKRREERRHKYAPGRCREPSLLRVAAPALSAGGGLSARSYRSRTRGEGR